MSTTIKDGIAITHLNPNIGGGGSIPESLVETTYSDLKALRDGGNLVAGQLYRITDYHCTTTQENTHSADHQFDIIVLALDASHLSEEAWAAVHEGDTYFTEAGANLSAWKIWYCLDNDTARFAWADGNNGSGVIYRMIDEWGNDCPYDFKNIMFKRKLTDGAYDPENGTDTWVYTFNGYDAGVSGIYDLSVVVGLVFHNSASGECLCGSNIIRGLGESFNGGEDMGFYYGLHKKLNDIVFLNIITDYANRYSEEWENCSNNTFGNGCYDNTFGNNCSNNTFGNECSHHTFGGYCYSNTFGDICSNNTFGDDCYDNTFGHECYDNIFGDNCAINTFGDICINNIFGNDCQKKHLEHTHDKTSGISGSTPEYWFNGTKKW